MRKAVNAISLYQIISLWPAARACLNQSAFLSLCACCATMIQLGCWLQWLVVYITLLYSASLLQSVSAYLRGWHGGIGRERKRFLALSMPPNQPISMFVYSRLLLIIFLSLILLPWLPTFASDCTVSLHWDCSSSIKVPTSHYQAGTNLQQCSRWRKVALSEEQIL